jgi:dTMP kinase
MTRGKYIVLEGPDGVGKSSVAQMLCENLTSMGVNCVKVQEPSTGKTGMRIRQALKEKSMSEEELYILFLEDRKEQEGYIKEQLCEGITVISDRSFLSTLAYQTCYTTQRMLTDFLSHPEYRVSVIPDLAFILHCDHKELKKRLKERGKAKDQYEKSKKLKEVAATYQMICDLYLPWVISVDTTGSSVETVLAAVTIRSAFECLGGGI